jgi:cytochrome b
MAAGRQARSLALRNTEVVHMTGSLIRVWDLPTRLFHWALVACVAGLVVTGQIGGAAMDWHFRLGYAVLGLLCFRLAWGFGGGYWSRFASFSYGPGALLAYLRGQADPRHEVGHNPLGALSVYALLLVLLAQVFSGLFSDDEIAAVGPLSKLASGAIVSKLTFYHTEVGKLLLLFLVVLHIAAILFYLIKRRRNLIRAMVIGDKLGPPGLPASRDDRRTRTLAALLALACAALVFGLLQYAG